MPRPGSSVGLVGRGAEQAELTAALDRAREGRAAAVLLSGDAGVGKSRLVGELAAEATAAGARVLVGRCLDVGEASLPYLPFTEVLAALRESAPGLVDSRAALRRLVPGSAPDDDAGAPDRELARLQVFEAVLSALTEAAREAPVLLVLEDLHWADRSSRELVTFLLSRLGVQRVLVLATYRADDLHRRHPLRAVLAELVRLPAVARLELGPLDRHDTLELVRALASEGTDEHVMVRIAERCEGNAFFAEEMVAACSDGLPEGLAEVLLARTERLSEPARALLRVASVADRRIRHAVLGEVSGLGTDELEQGLREAVAHHVLVPDGDAYAFRHALLREAVHDDLLPGERSRLHARLADLLAARGDEPGVAAELARHAMAAHDLPRALAASVRAAEEADRRHGPAEALLHAERALELWSAVEDPARVAGVAESVLTREAGTAAGGSGDPERGAALALRAVQLADAHDGPRVRADARRQYALRLLDSGGGLQAAITAATEAVALLDEVPDVPGVPDRTHPEETAATRSGAFRTTGLLADRAWAHAVLARALLRADLHEPARRHAGLAVSTARDAADRDPGSPQGDPDRRDLLGARADGLLTLAFGAQIDGEAARSRELLAEAVVLAVESGNPGVELRTLWNRGVSFLEEGLLDAAREEFRAGVRRAEAGGLTWSGYGLDHMVGIVRVAFQQGDWAGAERAVRSVDAAVSSSVSGLLAAAGLLVGVARGELDHAERRVTALLADAPVNDQTILLLGQVGAESALWRGDPGVAARRVDEAVAGLRREVPHHMGELVLAALGVAARADAVAAPQGTVHPGTAHQDAAAEAEALLRSAREVARLGLPRGTEVGPEGRAWLRRAEAELTRVRGTPDPDAWTAVVEAFGYGDGYRQAHARFRRAEAALLLAGNAGPADAARLRRDAADDLRLAAGAAAELGARPLADAVAAMSERSGLGAVTPSPAAAAAADTRVGGNGVAATPLTPRERTVLEQVAQGLTNRGIGERLFISEKTVSVHLSRVMAKLGAGGRAEAVSIAFRRGLLAPGEPAGPGD
ncbi:AAA family ATPase [Pseudonocardia sp. KRD291]|uniref:helix-turn-helix transcriptional regulator n=1 Tax=Pseudonocardia sp. KRD291 TaxID=2792007 RepID=UPI0027E25BEE|nr:AAA family ATPase [Pseudonocardia sp. KRD291]